MKKVNVALIASGSGTDAGSIMNSWTNGCMSDVNISVLVSTKEGAKCLERARNAKVDDIVIDRKKCGSDDVFNEELAQLVTDRNIDLIFLVGCIVRYYPDKVLVPAFNIHPADKEKHGGDGMYGIEVHCRVIWDAIDEIDRGKKSLTKDRFFTYPMVHEVLLDYDSGEVLLTQAVEIPRDLLKKIIDGTLEIEEAAEELQKIVLPYEWLMLPAAVNIAARKISQQ